MLFELTELHVSQNQFLTDIGFAILLHSPNVTSLDDESWEINAVQDRSQPLESYWFFELKLISSVL